MARKPIAPTNVYPGGIAPHLPVEQYQQTLQHCQCGHSHGHGQAPVQQIIIKQSDPWLRYLLIAFGGAGVGLLVFASIIATMLAAGVCALCFAAAARTLRSLLGARQTKK